MFGHSTHGRGYGRNRGCNLPSFDGSRREAKNEALPLMVNLFAEELVSRQSFGR